METNYIRCLSNSHANLRYCDSVIIELWAAVSWYFKCALSDWDPATLTGIQRNIPKTTLVQFEPCDKKSCSVGTFHFHLGRHTSCTGATVPQWCLDTP